MVLKFWSLAFMLLSIMLLSGVVYGQYPGTTVDGIFYGEGTAVSAKDNNLLIGGINQVGDPNPGLVDYIPYLNPTYMEFANNNRAIYIPTYTSGNKIEDALNVDLAATLKATDQNGLLSPALTKSQQYDTIIGYSGGTASAVAALYKQAMDKNGGVTCNTLILISPMKGELSDADYKQKITRILDDGAVKNIVVLWSKNDKPTGNILGYQARSNLFSSDSRITVNEIPLTKTGDDGHIEMFFAYAMKNIKNGVYTDPQAKCTAKPNQLSGTKFPDWMHSPQSKTTSGLESWGKHPKGWGVSQEYVNAHPEIYGGPSSDFKPSSPQSGSDSGAGQPYDPPAVETNPQFRQNCYNPQTGSSVCPD